MEIAFKNTPEFKPVSPSRVKKISHETAGVEGGGEGAQSKKYKNQGRNIPRGNNKNFKSDCLQRKIVVLQVEKHCCTRITLKSIVAGVLPYYAHAYYHPLQHIRYNHYQWVQHVGEGNREARVAYPVSALPFTTKLQVKPGRTGSVAGWVTICAESQTCDSRE